ncbi:MAG: hypothetical protein V2A56_05540 [bacterium]
MKIWMAAAFFLLVITIRTHAQPRDTGQGKLWLPKGMLVHQAGDTLIAERGDSTGLTVYVYPVKTTTGTRENLLRQIAQERGISPHVRTVSQEQRELAGIEWGGFVLGTVPRQKRETDVITNNDSDLVVNKRDSLAFKANVSSQYPIKGSQDKGFQQPEGRLADQVAVILYVKGNKSFIMETSIRIPEGNPMKLTDIQRRWKP